MSASLVDGDMLAVAVAALCAVPFMIYPGKIN